MNDNNEIFNNNGQNEGNILDSKEHGIYNLAYLEKLNSIDPNTLNKDFIELYNNVTYSLNNSEYDGTSIFIVKYDDNSIRLVNSDDNKIDLFTKESIAAKRIVIVLFKESSIFYEMFTLGVIKDHKVELNSNIAELIKKWDGKKHCQTPDLVAEQNAIDALQNEIGAL